MTTPSTIASGRPSLSTRHTHHGCGPSANQISPFSYEGYLFVPSERHSREDRWTSAQPTKIAVSQGDLINEVIKQQRSGKTALEEFCGPRVDDAKRGMINNLIKERTTTESGCTYTLAAINIDKDYVSDEEPDFGEMSLRDSKSRSKELEKRKKETSSILIILQGSVVHRPDHFPADLSQNCSPNSAKTIESLSVAAEKFVPWTAPCTPTSSTPLRYIPLSYHNIDPNANRSDQSSAPQQVYQRSSDSRTRSERSSSVTSSDTTSSSSPLTPTSTTSNNECFVPVDHARNHIRPQGPPCPSAHALSGISMSAEPTTEKVLDENARKQQSLRMKHPPTQATESVRPYTVTSSSTQTTISITDPCEDGWHGTLNILKCGTGEMGRPSAANPEPESEKLSSLPPIEDRTTSTRDLMGDDDSPLHPQVARAKSPDIMERKPSWMDNMVPVTPPPAEVEPIETGLENTSAEYSVTEDNNPKRSNGKKTEHQNATKRDQPEDQETSYQRPMCDESLAASPMPAREGIKASAFDAEAKGRTPLRPQYTGEKEYTDSPSRTSAERPANKARDLPLRTFGRLRSYEKLRPTNHTLGKSHQPIDRQERYEDMKYSDTDPEKSYVGTSYPVPSLGKPRSYERIRPERPPTTSASQPAGIRKLYRIKTYDETDKTPPKHVKFSKPLASSSSLDVPAGSTISCPDTPPSSPRATLASDSTETPRTTSQATSRPPLPRQSNCIPVHYSDTRAPNHSSSKNNSSKQSTKSTSREVKSSDRNRDKENDSYSSCKPDNDLDSEPKTNETTWACCYKSCDRHLRPYATYEEAQKHVRNAHKRDHTGSE